ncbi:replication protein RepA [Oleiharenicola sp. Vm1]|uniref:replication protein RepA n=1 Tax=Oleiharenicola sp. Vm1 TaxID=3398393 RepID=UPI0039F56D25
MKPTAPLPAFQNSKLLTAFRLAGGTEAQFLTCGTSTLNDYELDKALKAGVDLSKSREFFERAKGLLGDARFSSLVASYAEAPGNSREPTAVLISRMVEAVNQLPKKYIASIPEDGAAPRPRQAEFSLDFAAEKPAAASRPAATPAHSIDCAFSPRRQRTIEKKLEIANAIQTVPPKDREAIAYSSGALVQANLPHSNPGNIPLWERRNGGFTFRLVVGFGDDRDPLTQEPKRLGCPYGVMPRLAFIHIVTQAKRTKSPRIKLADSFYEFLTKLGVSDSQKNYVAMRDQLTRLLGAHMEFRWNEKTTLVTDNNTVTENKTFIRPSPIADDCALWWTENSKAPKQSSLFECFIELNPRFYDSIIGTANSRSFAFPLDFDTISAIKRSSLAIDTYAWSVHRIYRLMRDGEKRVFISWRDLHEQFGADYNSPRMFRFKMRQTFSTIGCFWRGKFNYEFDMRNGIILGPSDLPVDPNGARALK